jgi:hypothetical protein
MISFILGALFIILAIFLLLVGFFLKIPLENQDEE